MMEFIFANWPLLVGLAAAGLTAGVAAGLFGIGGGVVIVPVLYFMFNALGFEETAMHVAVATSLATIIVTSARSVMAHHKRGAVDWGVVRGWMPWIMLGAISGMVLARYIPGQGLTVLFGGMAFILSAQLYFGRPTWKLADDLPRGAGRVGLGGFIGVLSALMGIGGGTFGVSLMTVCGRTIHQAVATAAGFGITIGAPAAISAIFTGWGREGLPPGSLGFVNVPAFALISVFTVTMAPVGAALAHKLNAALLRKLFGIVLAVVGARMLYGGLTA
ncbi:MAG: sulfite exporter TauE/SafE family protein [Hyphomonadaceae bacterium]|nr:sulfite exporter TauE/SafE family protein [Hyphomonadaceae bacterium]